MSIINKSLYLYLSCLFYLSSFQYTEGATLHALLIGDTYDDSLGEAIEEDMHNMHHTVKKIANITEMERKEVMLMDSKATRENVMNKIEKLKVQSDDVIIAYFSMHGYRTKAKSSKWPDLFFGEDDAGVDLSFFSHAILQKKPRLLIVIADCCNLYLPAGEVSTWHRKEALSETSISKEKLKRVITRNYKRLFLNTSGVIIASGSQPGQPSYGSDDDGSLFTLAFIDSLEDILEADSEANWENIFKEATAYVIDQADGDEDMDEPQIPQYQINVSYKR